ncbi:MAG: insulinase family protein [Saprospiraceae bacterium]|nr:insulinase family protein [Saprospiraceae bacterium]
MRNLYVLLFLLWTGKSVLAQEVDRSVPPVPGKAEALKLPEVKSFTLSNGLRIFLLENNALPLIQFQLMFNAGSVFDPADKSGLSNLVFDLVDDQTADRAPEAWADALDYLGVELESFSRAEQGGIRLFTPLSRVEPALDLLAAMLLRPDFPEGAIAQKKQSQLLRLTQEYSNARLLAAQAMRTLLYGKDHPLGKRFAGSKKSLEAISRTDVLEFADTFIRPQNAYLVVAGAIGEADLQALLEPRLQNWTGGQWHALAIPPPADTVHYKRLYILDVPEKQQTELRFIQLGPGAATEDYFAVQVMNTILGGTFASRLNLSLREKKGLAYGAASGFYFPSAYGYFVAQANVKGDVTGVAIRAFLEEFEGMSAVSTDEFERALSFLTNSFPKKFESLQSSAEEISRIVCYGLPLDFLCTYNASLQQLQLEDIKSAAARYILPQQMIVLAVGDRATIEAQLRELNLGPAAVLEVWDVLGDQP